MIRYIIACVALSISTLQCANGANEHIAVIGGGISGFSCASLCVSMGFPTVLCDVHSPHKDRQKQIENWPGTSPISWDGALAKVKDQFVAHKGRILESEVVKITKNGTGFIVETAKETIRVRAVVIATGQKNAELPYLVPQEAAIVHCLRDVLGFSPTDSVVVVGTGDAAVLAGVKLACRVQSVAVLYRNSCSASFLQLAAKLSNIETPRQVKLHKISANTDRGIVEYSIGSSRLSKSGTKIVLAEDRVPCSMLVKDLVDCDSSKAIITSGEAGTTSCAGIFACGEVTCSSGISASRATAEGLDTGWSVCRYLIEQGVVPIKPVVISSEPAPQK